jgi:hypothetical protein
VDHSAEGRQELSPPDEPPTAPASPSTAASWPAGAELSLSTARSTWRWWRRSFTIRDIGGGQFASMTLRGPRPYVVGAAALLATALGAAWRR